MEHASDSRHIVISADCHAGPRKPADYRPYVDPEYIADFDHWVEREERTTLNLFGAEVAESAEAGDAAFRSRRTAQLIALGVLNAGERRAY